MARKLTYEEVKHFIEVESGSGCKLLSKEYINSKEKLKIQCKCGEHFHITFNHFKRDKKYQCNTCGYKITGLKTKKSKEKFAKEVERYSNEYLFLEPYEKATIKIKVKHLTCGYVYKVRPNDFLSGYRCPKCGGTKKKTHEEFLLEVKNKYNDEFKVLEKYKTIDEEIKFLHNKCGTVFTTTPYRLLTGNTGCPKCNSSKGENMIRSLLDKYKVEFKSQDNPIIKNKYLRYDFFVNNKVYVEFDGKQHFKPFYRLDKEKGEKQLLKTQYNDKIKNQYCIDNNIPLIRIPYWEYDNIEYILKNVLMYFNLIQKDDTYDESVVKKYLVDKDWDHDKYIEMGKNYK